MEDNVLSWLVRLLVLTEGTAKGWLNIAAVLMSAFALSDGVRKQDLLEKPTRAEFND